jgi:hypothetical protein
MSLETLPAGGDVFEQEDEIRSSSTLVCHTYAMGTPSAKSTSFHKLL